VVAGKVVEVVEGQLRQPEQGLGFLVWQAVGFDGYTEGEYGATGLRENISKTA
jgi:hypothetical protein